MIRMMSGNVGPAAERHLLCSLLFLEQHRLHHTQSVFKVYKLVLMCISTHADGVAEAEGLDANPGADGGAAAPQESPSGSGNAASALEAFMDSSAQPLFRQTSHTQTYSRSVSPYTRWLCMTRLPLLVPNTSGNAASASEEVLSATTRACFPYTINVSKSIQTWGVQEVTPVGRSMAPPRCQQGNISSSSSSSAMPRRCSQIASVAVLTG